MLKDNLGMLRNIHGFSQEAIAEKIGISRQAYAKWETGATIPDVEKCGLLCLIIPLFKPQATKERNWENEEEI